MLRTILSTTATKCKIEENILKGGLFNLMQLSTEAKSENNKQSSKYNFTNFPSESLKDCQRDLTKRGKIF
jgi:hypothetical protein